ncbi:hypothetical protein ABZ611_16255 [Streptomyces sp. NPDC007861]|uniref:hypothetical protein n=1 Tax=Streptomyces sp. NPDC007861 TaxID=3154893 RepID=UPI0033DCCA09
MKHAAKTLGAAALGAVALGAAGAGTAAAAPQAPQLGTPLGLLSTLQDPAVTSAVGQAAQGLGPSALPPGATEQVAGLLGGLPLDQLAGSGLAGSALPLAQ